jgi:hypothetical protein
MNKRRRISINTLELLERQVVDLIADKRDDAGCAALRAVVDPENQDAAADRELAVKLNAQADGCTEVLALITSLLALHGFGSTASMAYETHNRAAGSC